MMPSKLISASAMSAPHGEESVARLEAEQRRALGSSAAVPSGRAFTRP